MAIAVQSRPHTRKRSPQLNEANMSSVQTTDATAAAILPWVDYVLPPGRGIEVPPAAVGGPGGEGGSSFANEADRSRSPGTATTESSTVLVDSGNKPAPMKGDAREAAPVRCAPEDEGHRPFSMELTESSLQAHDFQQLHRYPYGGVAGWVGSNSRGTRLAGDCIPSIPDSLRPKKSSKPSVASSGYHDFHVVIPDEVAESIVAIGSQYDNCVIDPSICDRRTLSFPLGEDQ